MGEFWRVLVNHSFMQHAVLAGILAGFACGVSGAYVVVKRITFISGGIAHAVLGGMGIAYYYRLNPFYGAIVFALLAAVLLGTVKVKIRQHEDTVIGALWAVGMATGIIFMSLTPGYNVDLMSFLFGNILMVSHTALLITFVLDAVIFLVVLLFYRQFLAVCFDEDAARLRGLPVEFLYILLLCLIALTIVILIQVVGLILVIALLTIPAAIARLFSQTLTRMMVWASILGGLFTVFGLAVSFTPNLPAGATIIIIAGIGYIIALGMNRFLTFINQKRNTH